MRRFLFFILLVIPALALPAQAGIFSKKARTTPQQRVPELLYIVKADPDEGKRTSAAAELREYDAKNHPEMLIILTEVLRNDTKPSVRREAAITLGRLRPISQSAGLALQKSAANDPSLRVRIQAWSALKLYQLSGFNPRAKDVQSPVTTMKPNTPNRPKTTTTKEPPIADPSTKVIQPEPKVIPPGSLIEDTPNPPGQGGGFSRPLPSGKPNPTVPPTFTPPQVVDDGPVLVPQKN